MEEKGRAITTQSVLNISYQLLRVCSKSFCLQDLAHGVSQVLNKYILNEQVNLYCRDEENEAQSFLFGEVTKSCDSRQSSKN